MGVDRLKIEGRLKTEYYLASVVNAYRNAIDDYEKDKQNYDYTKYLTELEKIINLYYKKNRGDIFYSWNDQKRKIIYERYLSTN